MEGFDRSTDVPPLPDRYGVEIPTGIPPLRFNGCSFSRGTTRVRRRRRHYYRWVTLLPLAAVTLAILAALAIAVTAYRYAAAVQAGRALWGPL